MPHIHTAPGQHDHTVSAYIVLFTNDQPKIFLHNHKKLHTLLQFGGHIELNETPWAAIAHEIKEEAGYTLDQLHVLQPRERLHNCSGAVVHPLPCVFNTHTFLSLPGHFHTDVGFAFITSEQPKFNIGHNESKELYTFTKEEITHLSSAEIYDNTREMCLFVLDTIVPNWEPILATDYLM